MPRSLILSVVLVLALVGAALWWLDRDPDPPPATVSEPTLLGDPVEAVAPKISEPEITPPEALKTTPFPPETESSGAEAATSPSGLRVEARWPDGSPARDVMISILGSSYARGYGVCWEQHLSDDDGRAVFAGLPRGKWSVRSDRDDRKTVEYQGGEQSYVFKLRGGVRVQGTVVDGAAAPVPGASIWLQTSGRDWSSGRVVATSDEAGCFELDRIPSHLSLGAIARGFAPSELLDLDLVNCRAPVATVRMQLGDPGGSLVGTVTDTAGQAIPRALVAIGRVPRFVDEYGDLSGGRVVEQWSCRWTRSDARGRYAFEGIRPGPVPVSVRAEGYGIWRTPCPIAAGQTTELPVEMPASATISGIVTDGTGAAVPGAILRCYDREPGTEFISGGQIDFDEALGGSRAASAPDGSYAIRDVSPGIAFVFAQVGGRISRGGPGRFDSAKLEVSAGAAVVWNPVITEGHTVEGRVTYQDGHPMSGVPVTLVDERSNQRRRQMNDRSGVFRFVNLDDSTYSVYVYDRNAPKATSPLRRSGIVPDQGRVEIRVPSDKPVTQARGTVIGRIDDAARRITNIEDARVVICSESGWPRQTKKITDGAFRFDRVQPGGIRLTLVERQKTLAQSDWHELQPGATLDTGVLGTEPGGSVHITLARPEGTETVRQVLSFRSDTRSPNTIIEMGRESELTIDGMTPGHYQVAGLAHGGVDLSGEVTITAGATAELPLTLRAGVLCRFQVWFPRGGGDLAHDFNHTYTYTITDRSSSATDGEVFLMHQGKFASTSTRPLMFNVTVPAGRHAIALSADDHLFAEETFTVLDGHKRVQVRLDLAPK